MHIKIDKETKKNRRNDNKKVSTMINSKTTKEQKGKRKGDRKIQRTKT